MGEQEINAFLTHLAVNENVAAATQNLALNAIVFLYKQVLKIEIGDFGKIVRAKNPKKLAVVFTKKETKAILANLSDVKWIMANLLYGSGLRLIECLRLRVQDIDFEYNQIMVRNGKGQKDRATMLAEVVREDVKKHLKKVKLQHEKDLQQGFGSVYLPLALSRKYPNAAKEWKLQYVLPAKQISIDPRTGIKRRNHLDEAVLQKAVKVAIRNAGINKLG